MQKKKNTWNSYPKVAKFIGVVEDGVGVGVHATMLPQIGQQSTNVFYELAREFVVVSSVKSLAQSVPKIETDFRHFELGMVHAQKQQVQRPKIT